MDAMPIIERTTDWNALIILASATIIAILYIITRLTFPDFYKLMVHRLFIENFSGRQITKPTEVSSIEALTIIISILSISTMAFTVVSYSDYTSLQTSSGSEWKSMIIAIISFSAYNFLKGMTNLFLGFVYRLQNYATSYNTLILDTERMLSFIFLPIFAFCPFVSHKAAQILILVAIIATVILVGFQFATFFSHLVKNKFLNHHSILYFCALEVLPILVVIKLVF